MMVDKVSTRGGAVEGGCYYPVCCAGCGSVLGRLYTAAGAPDLACLVNNFALDASRCSR